MKVTKGSALYGRNPIFMGLPSHFLVLQNDEGNFNKILYDIKNILNP